MGRIDSEQTAYLRETGHYVMLQCWRALILQLGNRLRSAQAARLFSVLGLRALYHIGFCEARERCETGASHFCRAKYLGGMTGTWVRDCQASEIEKRPFWGADTPLHAQLCLVWPFLEASSPS